MYIKRSEEYHFSYVEFFKQNNTDNKHHNLYLSSCGAQYQKWTDAVLCGKWGTVEQNTEHNKQNTDKTGCGGEDNGVVGD